MDPISSHRRSPLLCRSQRVAAIAALSLCSGFVYAQPEPPSSAAVAADSSAHRPHLPEVTDIRHWSAPNSTRIVINLDADAKYDSARVTNPDRIYVDIKNSHLGQFAHLINVDDDAYVKDIRAAQFTPDTTRIVLDVKAAADYSVEMLSNPTRLVIDVHSHHSAAPAARTEPRAIDAANRSAPALTPAPAPIKTAAATAPAPSKALPVADKKPAAAPPATAPHETLPQHPTPYVYKEPFYVSPEARATFTAQAEPTKSESAKAAPIPASSAPSKIESAKSEPIKPESIKPAPTKYESAKSAPPARKPTPAPNELTTLVADSNNAAPAPAKPVTRPAPVTTAAKTEPKPAPEKTIAKSEPTPEKAIAKSQPKAEPKPLAAPETSFARSEPLSPPVTSQPKPQPLAAKSEPPTPIPAPERAIATAPAPAPASPAHSDSSVAIDANGHETGVAHPPQDVTITPDDDNTPVAPEKPSLGSALGPTAPAKSVAPPPPVEVAAASVPPAPSTKPTAKSSAAHRSAPASTAPRHIIADDSAPVAAPDSASAEKPASAGKSASSSIAARKSTATKPAPRDSALALSAAATISHSESAASAPHHPSHTTAAPTADTDDGPPANEVAISALPSAPDPHSKSTKPAPAANFKSARNKKSAKLEAASADPDAAPEQAPDVVRAAAPTADGERSLTRALGLKIGRIVIDAGHGGHDAGSVGPDGLEEKDVTLDIALRLGKLLKQRLGADVIYTRKDDRYVPLQERTTIANREQADLFVSIHANSSSDSSARGVETYYLNFTSSPGALEVAARENAVSELPMHDLQDLVKKITLKDKLDESKEFANDVERDLYDGVEANNGSRKDRGVKQAPFVVLIGANMPSILTEISFVSNPEDARQLRDPAYRQRIADALYHGIAKYMNGLSSVRVAENRPHGGN